MLFYASSKNYSVLADIYKKLIILNPENNDYWTRLPLFTKKAGTKLP